MHPEASGWHWLDGACFCALCPHPTPPLATGLGGLAVAAGLAARGYDVHVFEGAPGLR